MAGSSTCPGCRAALRPRAAFCVHCGLEVCHPCPACGASPRWVATLERGNSPWCEGCEALLDACQRCGRWLLPGSGACPDPQCGGQVLPAFPQYTGRRWDGAGSAVRFSWPLHWERDHPEYTAPRAEWWVSGAPVEAAFIAHGRLFLWEGGSLVTPDEGAPWAPREVAGELGAVAWRSPLGPATIPAPEMRFEERVAVAGSRAILASTHGFVQVDLRHAGGVAPVDQSKPLAQAGGSRWWIGWGTTTQTPRLLVAPAALAGIPLAAESVPTPAEAQPLPRARVVLCGERAYWPARNGAVWALDATTRTLGPVSEPAPGLVDVWAGVDGPRWVTEAQGQIAVTLAPPRPGRAPLTVAAGSTPYRGVHSRGIWTVVVGERISTFDTRTGERLHEAIRPPGRWIDAALVQDAAGEPRLLVLTRENGLANLTLVRLASGVHDLVWQESGIDPRALLPVESSLYLAHSRGLVRFRVPGAASRQESPSPE